MSKGKDTIRLTENDSATLPILDVLTGRGFITGKSGSGKSNTASVIAEELLDAGHAMLIVDTDGEYYGLKEAYEILHAGADETCDIQVGPEHAGKLAEIALRQNVPVVLDVSGYIEDKEARSVVQATAKALYDMEHEDRRPFLLMVEEVHEYLPEGPGLDELGETLIRIAKRGRKRGLGFVGISQRPADVKKDFITQCNYMLWHRLTWENDTKVVRRVVSKDASDLVQGFDDGEALLVADFLEERGRVQVRRKKTIDLGATPGLEDAERPELKSISGDLVSELQAISEKESARKDELSKLREKVKRKEKEIEDLEEELGRARDLSDMARQFTSALAGGGTSPENVQAAVEEIRGEKNDEIRALKRQTKELEQKLSATQQENRELAEKAEAGEQMRQMQQHLPDIREAIERLAEAHGVALGGDEQLRERAKRQKERIENLEHQLKEAGAAHVPSDAEEFLKDPVVKRVIAEAKKEGSPRYVKGVVASLLHLNPPVVYEDIADALGVETTSHIGKAVALLEGAKIVKTGRRGKKKTASFNLEGLEEIKRSAARRKRTASLVSSL